jgi:hypothetical protein
VLAHWIAGLWGAVFVAGWAARRRALPWVKIHTWRLVVGGMFVSVLSLFAAGVCEPYGALGAVIGGLAASAFFSYRLNQALRRWKRVTALIKDVTGPDSAKRLAGLSALEAEIQWMLALGKYEQRALWVLGAASLAVAAGQYDRALAWTHQIDPSRLSRTVAAKHAELEAGLRILVRDREGARRALARAPRPAPGEWEESLLAIGALLEALDGDVRSADERASSALAKGPRAGIKRVWQTVRAHALVKLDSADAATALLHDIRAEHGVDALRRVIAHAGPASPLAERVLAEQGPYR